MRDIVDSKFSSVRAAAVLTNSYVTGTVLTQTRGFNQLSVMIQFTLGSLTSAEIRIEFSIDNSTWFQEVIDSANSLSELTSSQGDRTLTSSGNYAISIPISYNFIRISAKGTGTVTSSSMTIDAILSRQ